MREIIKFVQIAARSSRVLLLTLLTAILSCHAQTPAAASSGTGAKLSPELARRVDVMIRSHSELPISAEIGISERKKSEVPGYDLITVTFSANGTTSRPMDFLLSADGNTLAQFNKFDLSKDPKDKVSAVGRPARGGPENAPVMIVGFDDLECPFCARMHAELFPALLDRYKDQIRIAYLDFPLNIHAWAMRAAVNGSCLATANPTAYWNYVDYVHAHAGEIGGGDNTLAKAGPELDKIAKDEGARRMVNADELAACIAKQDDTKVKAAMKVGESLGIGATPTLFINGEVIDGQKPIEDVFRVIDEALVAAGKTPPPPVPTAAKPVPAKPEN